MFAIEALKSHVEELPGIDSNGHVRSDTRPQRALSIVSWQQMASAVIKGPSYESFQSGAVAFCVRAAEAFSRCDELCVGGMEGHLSTPDAVRSALCCQLLGELASVCKPFAGPLQRIRDEAAKAIFSNFYSDDGSLHMKQLTYFAVAERLESEKQRLVEEVDGLRSSVNRMKDQVESLEIKLDDRDHLLEQLRESEAAADSRSLKAAHTAKNAQVEASAVREEMKALRKDLLKLRNEDNALRAMYNLCKSKLEQQTATAERDVAQLSAELAAVRESQAAAAADADARAARLQEDVADLQQSLAATQASALELAQRHAAELDDHRGLAAKQLQDSNERLARLIALLAPDPCPGPIDLHVENARPCKFVTGLGMGNDTPRYLRWSGNLALHEYDCHQTRALIRKIWADKESYERGRCTQISLPDFLFTRFWTGMDPTAFLESLDATHARAVQGTYSLLYAAQHNSSQCYDAALFWATLAGQLPPNAAQYFLHEVPNGVWAVRQAAGRMALGPLIPKVQMQELLVVLLPDAPVDDLTRVLHEEEDPVDVWRLLDTSWYNETRLHGERPNTLHKLLHTLLQKTADQSTSFTQALPRILEGGPSSALTTATIEDAFNRAADDAEAQLDTDAVSILLCHSSTGNASVQLHHAVDGAAPLHSADHRAGPAVQISVPEFLQLVRWKGPPILYRICDPSAAITWLQEHQDLLKDRSRDIDVT